MKIKVKVLEKRNMHIHYEIYEDKTKINSGWWKFKVGQTKWEIAKDIENMYYNK